MGKVHRVEKDEHLINHRRAQAVHEENQPDAQLARRTTHLDGIDDLAHEDVEQAGHLPLSLLDRSTKFQDARPGSRVRNAVVNLPIQHPSAPPSSRAPDETD